jgi:hypothetical protein
MANSNNRNNSWDAFWEDFGKGILPFVILVIVLIWLLH